MSEYSKSEISELMIDKRRYIIIEQSKEEATVFQKTKDKIIYDRGAIIDVLGLATDEECEILNTAIDIMERYGRLLYPSINQPQKDKVEIIDKKEYDDRINEITKNGIKSTVKGAHFASVFYDMKKAGIIDYKYDITVIEFIASKFNGKGLAHTTLQGHFTNLNRSSKH